MASPPPADPSALVALVLDALRKILQQRGQPRDDMTPATRLLGPGAVVDSLGLVTLIVDLEQRIEDEFGATLTLASERAMSRSHSPFQSVQTIVDHVHRLLTDADPRA